MRRIGMALLRPERAIETVRLPWGALVEVNANECIGRELIRQNVFDIAVSETAWRLLKPGDMAVDVGANVGYMTSLFAARVGVQGRVEAFEPHPHIFARLRRNLHSPEVDGSLVNVRLHDCALGDRDGIARLVEPPIFGINEGTSTVGRQDAGSETRASANGFDVRIARYDSMITDCEVALLKVDVEGFEPQVLAGAERSLAQRTIHNIIYEAHDCERSELHALMARYGYSIFGIGHDLLGLKLTPGVAPPKIDRGWESPSYLATLHPQEVVAALRPRGWRVLHAC
jgi:FkbM family methyltransferase